MAETRSEWPGIGTARVGRWPPTAPPESADASKQTHPDEVLAIVNSLKARSFASDQGAVGRHGRTRADALACFSAAAAFIIDPELPKNRRFRPYYVGHARTHRLVV